MVKTLALQWTGLGFDFILQDSLSSDELLFSPHWKLHLNYSSFAKILNIFLFLVTDESKTTFTILSILISIINALDIAQVI
jgi:hypothetical protein